MLMLRLKYMPLNTVETKQNWYIRNILLLYCMITLKLHKTYTCTYHILSCRWIPFSNHTSNEIHRNMLCHTTHTYTHIHTHTHTHYIHTHTRTTHTQHIYSHTTFTHTHARARTCTHTLHKHTHCTNTHTAQTRTHTHTHTHTPDTQYNKQEDHI